MEDKETTTISSSDGWLSNRNYFQLHQGTSWCKETWHSSIKYELNYQWDRGNIDNRYPVCFTMEYLPKNKAKDEFCFLERCSLLCWILSICHLFLAALHFFINKILGQIVFSSHMCLTKLKSKRNFKIACSILVTSSLAACRYTCMALKGILIKTICRVDLSSCPI